jgi:hypothetical protein
MFGNQAASKRVCGCESDSPKLYLILKVSRISKCPINNPQN